MRFCLIGPVWPYRGGISHNSAIIANAMLQGGHEILLVSFKRQYPRWLYPGRTDKDNSQSPLKAPAEYILDPLSPLSWYKAAKRVSAFKPELVAIQWWTVFWSIPFAYIGRYLNKKGTRLTFLIHNVVPHESHFWDKLLAWLSLNTVQNFVVFSDLEKQKLLKLLPNPKIWVTPLPAYSFEVSSMDTAKSAREILSLPLGETLLLFFGFVRPYKGLDVLLEAMKELKVRGIRPNLAIVGEFWSDKQVYVDNIQKYGLNSQVRIEDRYVPNEEAALWFRAADVMVAPYVEGVTQSAVASLAAGFGTPMIVTTEVAQGLGDTKISRMLVVPPGDVLSLARCIEDFMAAAPDGEALEFVSSTADFPLSDALCEIAKS